MRNIDNNMMTIWLVQLGKMFYAGGLIRYPNNDESFSFEFVRDEEVAFCILFEEVAERIAEKCGGTVVKREILYKEVSKRSEKHGVYMDSEGEVVKEFKKQALWESIRQDEMSEITKESVAIPLIRHDKMSEIIKESFLMRLIQQGFSEFEYGNSIFYAGNGGDILHQSDIQPEKETIMALVQKMAKADKQDFNWSNPLIQVVQHPSVYMSAKLDAFEKGELTTKILIKEEYFKPTY